MGNPYYSDEYEDYDDYDYDDYDDEEIFDLWCPVCGLLYEICECDPDLDFEAESRCDCGAIIDAQGNCPYCDYLPVE